MYLGFYSITWAWANLSINKQCNDDQKSITQVAHIEEILNEIGSGPGGDKGEEDEGSGGENWEDYETESEEERGMDHA